jgi:hypothetical protein
MRINKDLQLEIRHMSEFRHKIIQAYSDGIFLKELKSIYRENIELRESIGEELAFLHNQKKIDVVSEFMDLRNDDSNIDFFGTRHFFGKCLRFIDAPVADVMQCVTHLTVEAGNDLAAGILYPEFAEFCFGSKDRPKQALNELLKTQDIDSEILTRVLIAGSRFDLDKYLSTTIELLHDSRDKFKIGATSALGHLEYGEDGQALKKAFDALVSKAEVAKSDHLLSIILQSVFEIYKQDSIDSKSFEDFYLNVFEKKGPYVIHAVASLLFRESKYFSDELKIKFLTELKSVNCEHSGTLDLIDNIVAEMISTNLGEYAVSYLEFILIQNRELIIGSFDGTVNEIIDNESVLNKIVTKWFLSKRVKLCRAVHDIVASAHNKLPLNLDESQISKDVDYIFLARKCCGWLVMFPVSAGSYFLSIYECAPKVYTNDLDNIFFDLMLLNYPGELRKYIFAEKRNFNTETQKWCDDLLERLSVYHDEFEKMKGFKEFKPSAADLTVYQHKEYLRQSEIHKEARNNSIFASIAQSVVLLYGEASITYTNDLSDEPKRVEFPLQSFTHSIEYPSLDILDPIRLDYYSSIFRIEGCES